jgi:hypothetical protein
MADRLGQTFRVVGFPAIEFRSFAEFDQYYRQEKPLIDLRWRYEQSLATTEKRLLMNGTCGLCLVPVTFTSSSSGGEITTGGRVPNWRENLVCACERRLINRERALLHYLVAAGALQPWMRIVACGDLGGLRPVLAAMAASMLELEHAALEATPAREPGAGSDDRRHLLVWVESLERALLSPRLLAAIAERLTPGGRFVFTAPFDASAPDAAGLAGQGAPVGDPRFVGWDILPMLLAAGFHDAKASLYWSDELGYLGPLNFIFSAAR